MKKCPVCGNEKLQQKTYYEQSILSEVVEKCENCNSYSDIWAYGVQSFLINNTTWDFIEHNYMTKEQEEYSGKMYLEIYKELKKCKFYNDEDF
jgi:hypothetical protein